MADVALDSVLQDSFAGGIWRETESQRAPRDTAYDIGNGLLDDDLGVYRRGGSGYKTFDNLGALLGLMDGFPYAGQRSLYWTAAGIYTLAANDTDFLQIATSPGVLRPLARPVGVGGALAVPYADNSGVFLWGGSRKTRLVGQSVTWTAGSKTLTGIGTSWLANADRGMYVNALGAFTTLVASVDSNTQITMRDAPPTTGAAAIVLQQWWTLSAAAVIGSAAVQPIMVAAVGSRARLVLCEGNRAFLSARGDPLDVTLAEQVELPPSSVIVGADALRDNLVLFTTDGVWTAGSVSLDQIDDYANNQWPVANINKDVILWGDPGIAAWHGALIVPALDDVFLLSADGVPQPISRPIRPLYRAYVKAGYKPGVAAVHRGHLMLPILDSGNAWVDTLVCRLDGVDRVGNMRPGWTRWDGHGGTTAGFAVRQGVTVRAPKLFAITGQRVSDLSGCFEPAAANKNDADGSTHRLTLVPSDVAGHQQRRSFFHSIRIRAQLIDAGTDHPTLTAEYATGLPGSAFTTLAGSAPATDSTTPYPPYRWQIRKRAQAVRLRIRTEGPSSSAVIRSVEVFYRRTARQ